MMMRKMSVKSYSNRWKNSKMRKSSCSQRVNKSKWLLKTIMQPKSPNNSQKTNKNPMYLKGSKILTMDRSHLIMIECQEKMMFFILFEETKKYHIMCKWRWMSFLSLLALFSTFLGPYFMLFCHQEAVCTRKDVFWLLDKLLMSFHFSIMIVGFAWCFQEEKIKSDWLRFRVIFLIW